LNVDVEILPGPLRGTVKAIPSKSQAHRALICAALADEPVNIVCEGTSKDIEATEACLDALKAGGKDAVSLPCGESKDTVSLPCGESGSTFRFLLPIVGALGRKASFILEGRLPERPLSPLYEELVRHGCRLSPQGSNPFTIEGKLTPGSYTLDAGVSSQFISGLLFALPLLDGDSELRLAGNVESFPYIGLTLAMLEKFGIKVDYEDMVFSIPGRQKYRSPGTVHIEGDWSNAAFWLCAGAIPGNVITVSGLDMNSGQGDKAVLEILKRFGSDLRGSDLLESDLHESDLLGSNLRGSDLRGGDLHGSDLHGIEINAADIPDLVPILSVVAAAAKGTTIIYNAGRLRIKESDRLAAVTDMLATLGADIRETGDGLIIHGGKPLTGGTVSSRGDHRIAMSAAIAAVLCVEPVVIQGSEAVEKSYPTFFKERRRLACLHNMGKK